MDDYMFKENVARCKIVEETTRGLEMLSYSDPRYNKVQEWPLSSDDFDKFLHRRGGFALSKVPDEISLIAGVRMILQSHADKAETFAPNHISLKPENYISMVRSMHLSHEAIGSTSVVGPFFWSSWDQDEANPHLQIIYRKADVRKRGRTRGWELIISHELNTRMTTGFFKGTPESDILECLEHFKACISDIKHPMLLPVIICSHDASWKTDLKQRDARESLRRIERAMSMVSEIQEMVDFGSLNYDLFSCYSAVLSKRPSAHIEVLDSIRDATIAFDQRLPERRRSEVRVLQLTFLSKLTFYRKKWKGIESYANTTLSRLDLQRNALYNIIAQNDSKLNLMIARDQRKIAHGSKRDSSTMKVISLLSALFLPGAFLASIFSTTFFDFHDAVSLSAAVSPRFWIYWAVTIPVTLLIVGVWYVQEIRRSRKHRKQDDILEYGLEDMERDIMAKMKKSRTMTRTWDTVK